MIDEITRLTTEIDRLRARIRLLESIIAKVRKAYDSEDLDEADRYIHEAMSDVAQLDYQVT